MTFDNKELRHIVWGSHSPEVHSAVELISSVSETLARMMTNSDDGASFKALDALDVAMFHARRALMQGEWNVAHIIKVANENPYLEWMRSTHAMWAIHEWDMLETQIGRVSVPVSWRTDGRADRLKFMLERNRFWSPEYDNGSILISIGGEADAHVITVGRELHEKMGDMLEWVLNAAYAGKRIDVWEPVAEGDRESRNGESRRLGGIDCGIFNPDADGGDNEDNTFTSRSLFAGKHCRIFQRHFGRGNLKLFGHDLTENELAAFELLAGHLERGDMPDGSNVIAYDKITADRLIASSVTAATTAENATHLPEGMVLIDAKELENLRAGISEDLTQGVHMVKNDRGVMALRGKGYTNEELSAFRALGKAIRDGEVTPKAVDEPYVSDIPTPVDAAIVLTQKSEWIAYLKEALTHYVPGDDLCGMSIQDLRSFVGWISHKAAERLVRTISHLDPPHRLHQIGMAAQKASKITHGMADHLKYGDDLLAMISGPGIIKGADLWKELSIESQFRFGAHYYDERMFDLDRLIRHEARARKEPASRNYLIFKGGAFHAS